MSTLAIVVVVVVVLLVVGAVFVVRDRQRKRGLQQRFGPEYERTVEEAGDRRQAERDLHERAERHRQLDIRPLDPDTRDRYAESWRQAQERFVDAPAPAVREAHTLVQSVMRDRGYPIEDFDQQARDVSVEHAHVVDDYRVAHDISVRNEQGEASTEDLREAMVRYRSLFEDLLGSGRQT